MSTYLSTYNAVSLLEKKRKMGKILPNHTVMYIVQYSLRCMLTPVLTKDLSAKLTFFYLGCGCLLEKEFCIQHYYGTYKMNMDTRSI